MKKHLERFVAQTGSYVSRTAVKAGPLGDWYIGSENPYFHKVPYHLSRTRASTIDPQDWARFEGDPAAAWRRSRWEKTGVILGKVSVLDAATASDEVLVRAVAFRFGDSVLAAAVPARTHEQPNLTGEYDDLYYEVGLRLGKGALEAVYGVWNQATKTFEVPEHSSARGPIYETYLDAPTGLLSM